MPLYGFLHLLFAFQGVSLTGNYTRQLELLKHKTCVHFDSTPEISGKCSGEIRNLKKGRFLYGYLQLVIFVCLNAVIIYWSGGNPTEACVPCDDKNAFNDLSGRL